MHSFKNTSDVFPSWTWSSHLILTDELTCFFFLAEPGVHKCEFDWLAGCQDTKAVLFVFLMGKSWGFGLMLPIYIYLSQTPAPLHLLLLLLLASHHHLRSNKLSSSALTVLEGKQQTNGQTNTVKVGGYFRTCLCIPNHCVCGQAVCQEGTELSLSIKDSGQSCSALPRQIVPSGLKWAITPVSSTGVINTVCLAEINSHTWVIDRGNHRQVSSAVNNNKEL